MCSDRQLLEGLVRCCHTLILSPKSAQPTTCPCWIHDGRQSPELGKCWRLEVLVQSLLQPTTHAVSVLDGGEQVQRVIVAPVRAQHVSLNTLEHPQCAPSHVRCHCRRSLAGPSRWLSVANSRRRSRIFTARRICLTV